MPRSSGAEFDAHALFEALDTARTQRGLTWSAVAREMWDRSAELNARLNDHPISPSTLVNVGVRGDTTCQHALFMLRWLRRPPEDFVSELPADSRHDLIEPGPSYRLRWSLSRLYAALDAHRREQAMTWPAAAAQLRCNANQLTGIRTARYAIGMRLAMRIVLWLGRPASDFFDVAEW